LPRVKATSPKEEIPKAATTAHLRFVEISKKNRMLPLRVKRLESALKALLEVAWPNPDAPDSRTNRAIARAKRLLREPGNRWQ
jgi:hypothetical protein